MATTTLPTFTRTIDDAFVNTWYEIRAEAIDNILNSTIVWNCLMGAGCFKTQVGSEIITRTISYGVTNATDVAKGDVLSSGEPQLETMAIWFWKYMAVHVQRDVFDDQKNNGPAKIKDYVGTRLTSARDGLEQKLETNAQSAFKSVETGKILQGLNDMVPPYANATTGTYGGINRPLTYATSSALGILVPATGNIWWGPGYLAGALATVDVDLLDDMKTLYNGLHNNQTAPNLIITTKTLFEIYETFAIDISQIIKDESTRLADLGFEVLRFKGKPIIWSQNMNANEVLFLNTDWIQVVYDPNLWFDMTEFKPGQLSTSRIAHIMCAANMISTQLRRHGRLTYS